jgi:polyisoprenyl-teichoic acid--peptidoglycan teichoic acid transferase
MDDERPRSLRRRMWARFSIASILIVLLTAGAVTTVALNTATGLARTVFKSGKTIELPKKILAAYHGGPQTFLIIGSDRRAQAKNPLEREGARSDTMLLVRLDPEQGQTSMLSIPRDLMVNITSPTGAYYPQEKINAAYTIGSKLKTRDGGARLVLETIKKQVFPSLQVNGVVDVNFHGFIQIVDALGCVYVNVDHRYYNVKTGSAETDYSEINLQPGYQKLCYRHEDSDFVRVARQQDFLRDLRSQISPSDILGQVETVAKLAGQAIDTSGFSSSPGEVIHLAKLIAFSQGKQIRQVKFQYASANYQLKGESFVTSTPELEAATLREFLEGHQKLERTSTASGSSQSRSHHRHAKASKSPASIGLYQTSSAGASEAVSASVSVPFRVLYPGLQTGPAEQQQVHTYTLTDRHNHVHHAYVIVFRQNTIGGYYDVEGTDWLDPPLIGHPDEERTIGRRKYMFFADGSHIHVIAWREGGALYWVTNTLQEDLSNEQLLTIASSVQQLH